MKLFSNLKQYAVEQDRISKSRTADKWQSVPYEIEDIKGAMLLAGECTFPKPLTFRLNVTGWHKIYLCFVNMRSDNYVYFKLTDDVAYCGMKNIALGSPRTWCNTEFAQEVFWKCADMTGQELTIDKPHDTPKNAACLAWVKLVAMTQEEIEHYQELKNDRENRCVHFHFDEDRNLEDSVDSMEALLIQEAQLGGTDIGECSFEISFDHDSIIDETYVPIRQIDQLWNRKDILFQKHKEEAYYKRVEILHQAGIKAYAANRMSVCSFHTPYDLKTWNSRFAEAHPEYYCVMRDKSIVNVCSYAYPKVRRHMIEMYREHMKYGFDGVTMIFMRGLHLAFEPPVIERFSELYPDVDPFTLPMADERLNGVWCEFMTTFLREFREALPGVRVNAVTGFSPDTARIVGLDVKTWVEEGLVDAIIQGHMEIYEDLDGCLCADGTIDLDNYCKLIQKKQLIRRRHGNSFDLVMDGAKKYLEICNPYGVDFAAVITWPRLIPYEKYLEYANELRKLGVEKFFCWNSNQVVWNLPEFHTASMLGHEALFEPELSRYYKVISIADNNISAFNPNWKG